MADVPTKSVTLSNGTKIPILGLGTSHEGGYCHSAVVYALKDCGYRHIDTAKRYRCEDALKKAIEESGVKREDIFITSKLWNAELGHGATKAACQRSLESLGVTYLDLYLIHWPTCPPGTPDEKSLRIETWKAMEELYKDGLCRAIGVSNFEIEHLEELKEVWTVAPHVNQIEHHIYYRPVELIQYCRNNNICVEGYCPLSKGLALDDAIVKELSVKYQRTASQILIRWNIQNEIITIPKSTKEERVRENSQVFDFHLSEEDMETLNDIHRTRTVKLCSCSQEKLKYERRCLEMTG
ncbi:9,11-endoperoxide prostaglandin H2 reductase-like [Ptychodera flava]|uniref:9,11-endoperoxide prostaglandin H2 reductase-like n=1 Tax=Ptychodera flava TaxID=63121 RepID=UPI00396A7C0B